MVGVLQPDFRPVYECLFCGSPDEAKSMGPGTPCKNQWIQNSADTAHPACTPLSQNIDDFLDHFQCHLSSHTWDRCDHSWKPQFFVLKYVPKFILEPCFSGFFSGDNSCHYRNLPDSVLRVLGAIYFYFCNYALNIE